MSYRIDIETTGGRRFSARVPARSGFRALAIVLQAPFVARAWCRGLVD